jgi:hypothetical protein
MLLHGILSSLVWHFMERVSIYSIQSAKRSGVIEINFSVLSQVLAPIIFGHPIMNIIWDICGSNLNPALPQFLSCYTHNFRKYKYLPIVRSLHNAKCIKMEIIPLISQIYWASFYFSECKMNVNTNVFLERRNETEKIIWNALFIRRHNIALPPNLRPGQ